MSKEDQIILKPYANLESVLSSCQNSTPLESLCPIFLDRLNRILPYVCAQELTIQGRGYCHNPGKYPSQLVFMVIQAPPIYGQFGHIFIFMPFESSWQEIALWPYPIMAPGPYPASVAALANSLCHHSPGQYIIYGPGGSFTLPGATGPTNPIQGLWPTPFD
ncbi:hypothetical protein O181_016433 [Austropuccinia psidii MF-1]|uniref:Uncharacterized protein n=1 Tax=Austropuccinia psidii MF-1 TaxID=1389203 RepID=A0A9Q3C4B6_9BASI|nr:hypothetical protein [Austropuccinia psidii MF-1]